MLRGHKNQVQVFYFTDLEKGNQEHPVGTNCQLSPGSGYYYVAYKNQFQQDSSNPLPGQSD